ncbi:MAG: orotidine-5'-phosphate decarboxylase [Gammaproteobacteria bacterium]|nr:orotidine-5'-phosphate decarboxylase [Gammaproteobacteria bacterium]
MTNSPNNSHDAIIIYALDFADSKAACQEIDKLYPEITFFKVGLELFLASSWEVVDYVLNKGGKVMLDLKFLDIPATVAAAVKQVNQHKGVSLLTVHGHKQTIQAAVAARENLDMKILGVTLLTSFGPADMLEFTVTDPKNINRLDITPPYITPLDLVLARAKSSLDAGADGLVASATEAKELRSAYGDDFVLVTPGIRFDASDDDQQRVATPQVALANGANYLVIGRPIREAADPLAKVHAIKKLLSVPPQ